MTINNDLAGRVALVTGAGGGGIGRATALALAGAGAAVAAADVDTPGAAETARLIEAAGGRAIALEMDVTDVAAVEAGVRRCAEELGPALVLVNVAGGQGGGGGQPISRMDLDGFDRTMRLNLYGPLHCCRAALPAMIQARWGRIVNIGSATAYRCWPGAGAYAIAKSAVPTLTKLIAKENGHRGITANCVVPAVTDTPGTRRMYDDAGFEAVVGPGGLLENPMHTVLKPADLAAAVLYLCCESGRFVTGQTLHVNAGAIMP